MRGRDLHNLGAPDRDPPVENIVFTFKQVMVEHIETK